MLLPFASTFAWKLVNTPNWEIMRGDVSIFRGGAGGMLYFSRGSVKGGLRMGASCCPEAAESNVSEIKQISRLSGVQNFIRWKWLKH
jgi:hypothetical protein